MKDSFNEEFSQKSMTLSSLHGQKRDLYIEKQQRSLSGTWSDKDEEEYLLKVSEINEKFATAAKKEFDKSAIKSQIDSEIQSLLERVNKDIKPD